MSEPDAGRDQLNVLDDAVSTPLQSEQGAEGFGVLVRSYRHQRGMTQGQVAARCGFSRQFVSDVERDRVPDIEQWQERTLPLVGVLRIPPEDLTQLGVLTGPEARLLRLAGSAGMVSRSWATGQVRVDLNVAELGELAAVAAELAGAVHAEPGDDARALAVSHARTRVIWLLGLVGCWGYRLQPTAPAGATVAASAMAAVVPSAGEGDW